MFLIFRGSTECLFTGRTGSLRGHEHEVVHLSPIVLGCYYSGSSFSGYVNPPDVGDVAPNWVTNPCVHLFYFTVVMFIVFAVRSDKGQHVGPNVISIMYNIFPAHDQNFRHFTPICSSYPS